MVSVGAVSAVRAHARIYVALRAVPVTLTWHALAEWECCGGDTVKAFLALLARVACRGRGLVSQQSYLTFERHVTVDVSRVRQLTRIALRAGALLEVGYPGQPAGGGVGRVQGHGHEPVVGHVISQITPQYYRPVGGVTRDNNGGVGIGGVNWVMVLGSNSLMFGWIG